VASPDVATTYSVFARVSDNPGIAPHHAELLIDRQGHLRARWIGLADEENDHLIDLRSQISELNREPLPPIATEPHHH
jgi:hypothetical protein